VLRNRIFYTLKPLCPRLLQIYLRRLIARNKRRKYKHVWPIDPDAGNPPKNWRFWPQNKTFAFVLSHDVDTLQGYERVPQLIELEKKAGFRSAFNFVPERYGPISLGLIKRLKKNGFDVAVHGLKHDGKLFRSKRLFEKRALRINAYLKRWDAKGFTSPSMHHNLRWLSVLDIEYSVSTFDTDPFEPQPDALQSIYPLWVLNALPYHGFVELPYTLPQDFTLFCILQERDIGIWKQKLSWIAQNGGMALLNSHPDYMNFEDSRSDFLQYPVKYYEDFLEHIKTEYRDQYWHTTPREIALFWRRLMANTDR